MKLSATKIKNNIAQTAYLLGCLFVIAPLLGNVSNSLRNSLLFESSGRYLWSVWDYQTNPYIYSLNQKNGLSFQFADNQLFSLGGSLLLWQQPFFLGVQFQNSSSSSIKYNPRPENVTFNETITKQPDVRLMIGTLPFRELNVLQNFGFGFYFRYKENFRKVDPKSSTAAGDRGLIGVGEASLSNDRNNYSVTSYGIEFGQFNGGVHVKDGAPTSTAAIPISYSIGIGYHEYGSKIEEFFKDNNALAGQNDAPFLELAGGNTGFSTVFPSFIYLGPVKKEVTVHFLSWYVLNSFSNIGLSGNAFLQAQLKGTDNTLNTFEVSFPKNKSSEVAVTSTRIELELFYDLDLPIKFNKIELGILRLSPSIKGLYHKEKAEFDAVLGNGIVDSKEHSGNIGIAFKFYIFLNPNKSLKLLAGWHPRFNFSHKSKITRWLASTF